MFEVCNKLKTVKIVDLRWRRDGKDQICKLQGHEAGGAEWDTMRRGFVFSAGSNMLTRVHLSIRGGDSGWEAGGHQLFDGGSTGGRGRRGHVRQATDLAYLAAWTNRCVLQSRNVDIGGTEIK